MREPLPLCDCDPVVSSFPPSPSSKPHTAPFPSPLSFPSLLPSDALLHLIPRCRLSRALRFFESTLPFKSCKMRTMMVLLVKGEEFVFRQIVIKGGVNMCVCFWVNLMIPWWWS
ncbi:hypothetical protein GmHk_17G049491 [Glycine max]|nr:hypothetical protein GmHk_17G049491 [Glycine max]